MERLFDSERTKHLNSFRRNPKWDKLNSWQTRREAGTQSLGDFEIKVSPVAIQTAKKCAGRILQSDFLFVNKVKRQQQHNMKDRKENGKHIYKGELRSAEEGYF